MIEAADSRIQSLLQELGIVVDPQLFSLALTHRSWAYENGGAAHNERLEFLGDSLLGVVVTEHLYRTYPDHPEGQLAKLRAAVVSTTALAARARQLELGPLIRLGKGETLTGGADKDSILADTMEALIGAVYLSAGSDAVRAYVHRITDGMVAQAATLGAGLEWKMSLYDLAVGRALPAPVYTHEASGPDHDKRFTARACLGERVFPAHTGRSKKEAELGAARAAYEVLQAEPVEPSGALDAALPAPDGDA